MVALSYLKNLANSENGGILCSRFQIPFQFVYPFQHSRCKCGLLLYSPSSSSSTRFYVGSLVTMFW